jgi:hypothetical protein
MYALSLPMSMHLPDSLSFLHPSAAVFWLCQTLLSWPGQVQSLESLALSQYTIQPLQR